ncbi:MULTISPECIES: TrbI/VirB10 family protein [Acidobacterium]|uniref:Conjugation TrbI family protein n=1 Tax=Acidobacterium capsulatum (strain ATCC 51196 / DSM 11244 / BCRC 80197 / JCM 7670 / NBRC 15755 / NCIMB 13165 / 161) TaxID=240015 RepID=C1F9E5_ACIC5|nr:MULTISPECIES: TrbI/VirB10 family protein [Acidobacterium]ACO31836.1 hypothetical protein ACP_0299 [Acidobacterium capsulatum ATCC 51196]
MNFVRLSATLLVCGSLCATAARAQQSTPGSQQQPAQNSQNSQDQYTGVSNPPDTPIVTNEPMTEPDSQQDEQPLPTYTGSSAKPSPAVPAQPTLVPRPSAQSSTVPASAPSTQSYTAPVSNGNVTGNAGSNSANASSNPDRWDNTDFGIVTKIQQPLAPGNAQNAAAQNSASLTDRQNPDYGIVSVIPFTPNALNAGTNIPVRLLQPISTDSTFRGTPFRATVTANVYRGGQVIIPAGSELRGMVTSAHPGHRLRGRAELRLTPQLVLLPDGTAYHLDAQVVYSAAPHTQTSNEGVIRPSMHLAKDATEYGVGAGAGAIVGAHFGPGGALVGTMVGAGAVTAHLLMQPPSAVTLPRNTQLVFSLMQPMALTPTRN